MDETSIPLPPTPAEDHATTAAAYPHAVNAPVVDWSYDTVSDAPNYLSFEGGASGAAQQQSNYYTNSYSRGYNKGGWQQPRGGYNHGGYHNQAPATQYYGGYNNQYRAPPRQPYYRPQQQPYYQQPYAPPARGWGQNPNYNNYGYNNRGWNRGGYPGQRGRGGYGYGQYQNPRDAPISAFFHPSMLEDPWAALEARSEAAKEVPEAPAAAAAADVTVADDDPELLDLFSQLKGNAESRPEESAGSAEPPEDASAAPESEKIADQLENSEVVVDSLQTTTTMETTEADTAE